MLDNNGLLLVLAGLSGSGKSYITNYLVSCCNYIHIPSITTRNPRPGEVHGIDRFFCSLKEFNTLRLSGRLICESFMFSNWYANDVSLLNQYKEGKKVVCQLRCFSIKELKEKYPQAKCVYIWPKTLEEAIQHVKKRALDEEETSRRILEITDEVAFINADKEKDHPIIDLYFINDYSFTTLEQFVHTIKDL
jgi:guanylate kinase